MKLITLAATLLCCQLNAQNSRVYRVFCNTSEVDVPSVFCRLPQIVGSGRESQLTTYPHPRTESIHSSQITESFLNNFGLKYQYIN